SGPHQQVLPSGYKAILERHQILDRQHTAPLHREAVLLNDSIVALVAGYCFERCFGNPHAELGDCLDGAALLITNRKVELLAVRSYGLYDQIVVARLAAARGPAPNAGALARSRHDSERVFPGDLVPKGGELGADFGHRCPIARAYTPLAVSQ